MRYFSRRERRDADLFYADLMGIWSAAGSAAAPANRSDVLDRDGASDDR